MRAYMASLSLSRFWQFWTGELAGLVPRWDARRIANRKTTTELHITKSNAGLYLGQRLRIGLAAKNLRAEAATLADLLPQLATAKRVVVTLDETLALMRTVHVPKNLHLRTDAILDLEIAAATPFKREDVVSMWAAGQESAPDTVTQAIIRKSLLHDITQVLGQAGCSVELVTLRPSQSPAWPAGVDQLGRKYGEARDQFWKQTMLAAGLCAALTLLATALAMHSRNTAALADIAARIETARPLALAKRQKIDAIEASLQKFAALAEQRKSAPRLLVIWEELARNLPDQAWLQSLSLKGSAVQIEGNADNAESLIALLEDSALFSNVRFSAPVFQNPESSPASAKVHFAIAMDVEAGPS
jgi:general secretion pathway protein L